MLSDTSAVSAEVSVRQLIANGKSKVALEAAKNLHKRTPSPATEILLVDAYAARITALLEHNMPVEAHALSDLLRERFPAHAGRLNTVAVSAAARAGSLEELLAPLHNPQLDPARRAEIEGAIRRDISDLPSLAACNALAPDHPLRLAAAALDQAFKAVTSGRVDPATLEFPQLSRRSPLAPWKPLLLAIAHLHLNDDERCREFLAAVAPESAAARAIPAIQTALGDSRLRRLRRRRRRSPNLSAGRTTICARP